MEAACAESPWSGSSIARSDEECAARGKLKIVTLVRDPIGRNVSMYFQHLHYWLAHYFSEVRADRDGRQKA